MTAPARLAADDLGPGGLGHPLLHQLDGPVADGIHFLKYDDSDGPDQDEDDLGAECRANVRIHCQTDEDIFVRDPGGDARGRGQGRCR